MARTHLQWTGDTTYRGADQFLSESLTCYPGDKVAVSPEKAKELTEDKVTGKLWKRIDPEPEAKAAGGGALSTQNTQ